MQEFIDRRFSRRKYDAAKTLAGFAETARDEVDLGVLAAELQRTIAVTVQPAHMTLWLKEEAK